MNITHIIHLFRAYFIENKKMMLTCGLIVFTAAVLDLTLSYETELSALIAGFIPFIIAGSFFQSSLKKNNSTHFFNLPVTTAEKLVNAILVIGVVGVGMFLLFLAGGSLGDYCIRPMLNPEAGSIYGRLNESFFLHHIKLICDTKFILYYAVVLFVFLFGSIYFRKRAFVKTLVCGTGFFTSIALYILALLYLSFRNMEHSIEFGATASLRDFSFIEESYCIPIALIVFFLSLTYLRLKETEV